MANWQVAILILAAVLVGAVIPVLFELRATLRVAKQTLAGARPRVEEALNDVSNLVARVSALVEGVQSTTRVMSAMGASIGPAIVAGLSSYRSARAESLKEEGEKRKEEEEGEDEQRTRFQDRA